MILQVRVHKFTGNPPIRAIIGYDDFTCCDTLLVDSIFRDIQRKPHRRNSFDDDTFNDVEDPYSPRRFVVIDLLAGQCGRHVRYNVWLSWLLYCHDIHCCNCVFSWPSSHL